ncbi:MAG: IS110 family transposase [Planctomycetota bacterium]|nr:MAG: IS110 family transposase [Planctomycetota bacterium]
MTTTAKTTAADTILAIDLGKYKSVACVHDGASGTFRFSSFETTRSEMHRLLTRNRATVVIIEACLLAGWVHDLCAELGIRCLVANTASEAWKFKHLKRKTDRDDAQRLAQLYLLEQLPTVTLPPSSVRQWRSLIACRQALVGRRVAVQNRIRALFVAQGLPAPRGAKAWAATGLAGLASWARPLGECAADGLWRGLLDLSLTEYRQLCELIDQAQTRLDALGQQHADVVLLQTAPGLGPRTAETVAAYLHDAPRFRSAKQVSAYSGLVPRQHQSGEMDRRGRITKRGPALLRKMLVECAWCMIRYNAWARGIYQRLTGGGQRRKKQAIVALARKVLVRCWAMLRDRKPWHDPQTGPKPTLPPSKQRRQAQAQQRRQVKRRAAPAPAAPG